MIQTHRTRFRVPDAPPITLRVLAALLVILVIGSPAAGALADPAPKLVTHTDHLGSAESGGCLPLHDDAFCLSCRVASTHPVGSTPVPALPVPGMDSAPLPRALATSLPDAHGDAPPRTRAPPRR